MGTSGGYAYSRILIPSAILGAIVCCRDCKTSVCGYFVVAATELGTCHDAGADVWRVDVKAYDTRNHSGAFQLV